MPATHWLVSILPTDKSVILNRVGIADRRAAVGIAAMIAAMLLLPLVDATSKLLAARYAPEQVVWARNAVHALLIFPFVLRSVTMTWQWPNNILQHGVRAFCFVAMALFFVKGLQTLPLADALGIVFSFPLLITAMSAVFLGERVGIWRWSAVGLGLLGVCFIVRPGFEQITVDVLYVLGAAVTAAIYIILTRRLSSQTPSIVLLFYPAALGAIGLGMMMPSVWQTPNLVDAGLFFGIGAAVAAAHFLIIVAYKTAEASFIAPLTYLQIANGTLLGFLFFGDVPVALTWVGLAIVVGAGVVVILRERRRH